MCLDTDNKRDLVPPTNFVLHYVTSAGEARRGDIKNLAQAFIGLHFAGITSIGFAVGLLC